MSKQRTFRMHPRLLFQTIQRQAGTLAKAITEGVMNSVEAGASRVNVTLREDQVIIEDNGRGFRSMEEIENWFETFGMPHDESEGKIWANFRIGRGQMFSFGRNSWRTGRYEMEIDFLAAAKDADTLGYELREVESDYPGCRIWISLYRRLLPSDLQRTEVELKQLVKWVAVPVYLNGKRVSTDPAKAKWDYEDPLCYVKLRQRGGLAVYNLGVFVREYPAGQFGCGGDVVSKHQLRLNQARSDVLVNDCEVWRRVRKQINAFVGREVKRKPALTEVEKDFLATQLLAGELDYPDARGLKLFTDVTGKSHNWARLEALSQWACYSDGERYDRVADEIHQQKLAFVFARDCLDRFGVDTAEEMIRKVLETNPQLGRPLLEYRPLDDLAASFSRDFRLLAEDALTPSERVVLDVCQKAGVWLVNGLRQVGVDIQERKYLVGISDASEGWTDGRTYIALSRSWLQRRRFVYLPELTELAALLLHEYCHSEVDTDTHTHSPEFYQTYHDASDSIGRFVSHAVMAMPHAMQKYHHRIHKALVKTMDKIEVAKRLLPQVDELDRQGQLVAARMAELQDLQEETKRRKRTARKKKRGKNG